MADDTSAINSNGTNPINRCTGLVPTKHVEIGTYSVLLLLSLTGNALIVAAFFLKKVPRTTVNCFIVNMAFADLIIPVIFLPALITDTHLERVWILDGIVGTALCKLYWLASSLSTAVSIVSMVVIAAERFHAILFAMKPPLISQKLAWKIIALTWLFAVAFRSIYLYDASVMIQADNNRYCMLSTVIASLIAQLCLFALSGLLLMVFYISIITTLFWNKTASSDQAEAVKLREKENRRVTCMLVVVVVVFYAVWTPNLINGILFVFYPRLGIKQSCYFQWLTENVLPVLHTVITPLVYYVFNSKYRKAFKEMLCCPKVTNK